MNPIPSFFHRERAEMIYPVPYQQREKDAIAFRKANGLKRAIDDDFKVCLLLIDDQITFCLPPSWGQLFVGGRSGRAAIDDSVRTCRFIYNNIGVITTIIPTLDTHMANQIFHSVFWVDRDGNHPDGALAPFISLEDILTGRWMINPSIAVAVGRSYKWLQDYVEHYARSLLEAGKYQLQIWPYHAMLGGISHALVPAIEEAVFFHGIARGSQPDIQTKGFHPLTENYSVIQPEVMTSQNGEVIASKNSELLQKLQGFDMVVAQGQAKSHCFLWTMENIRAEFAEKDPGFLKKIYILGDCTSPVVIPGVVDFTEMADAGFEKLVSSGMHVVQSTEEIEGWK